MRLPRDPGCPTSAVGAALLLIIVGLLTGVPTASARTAASPCAGDATAGILESFLSTIDLKDDSTRIDFVRDGDRPSRLAAVAKRVSSPTVCRRAYRSWVTAVGSAAPTDTADTGSTAVMRVGSFHVIGMAGAGEVVVVDRRWRLVGVIGMDND